MSVKIMSRVWAYSKCAGTELVTVLALADWADDDGWCWPSLSKLAKKCRVTVSQLCKILAAIEQQRGEVSRERSTGGRNHRTRYRVTVTENSVNGNSVTDNSVVENSVIQAYQTVSPVTHALIRHRNVSKRARKNAHPLNSNPDSRINTLRDFWLEQYRARFAAPYAFNGKDAALLKGLLSTFSEPDIQAIMRRFLDSKDPWIQNEGGYTIGVFHSQYNKLVSTTAVRASRPRRDLEEIPVP
jgi:hypothetical protein